MSTTRLKRRLSQDEEAPHVVDDSDHEGLTARRSRLTAQQATEIRQAKKLLRQQGYEVKPPKEITSQKALERCQVFHKLVTWALSNVPPVLPELRSALAALARQLLAGLADGPQSSLAQQFRVRYEDLLKQGLRKRRHGPEEVQMSEVGHHLLLTYLARPEMTCLLDVFWDTVKVRNEPEELVVKILHDEEKRKSKRLPLPADVPSREPQTDPLHREPKIVSLLIAPEAQAAAVSEDQRLCAAGCDRDVRIFRADGANLKSMTSEMRLEGERLGSHGGRVLSTAFSSEFLLTGGQDRCLQLWNAESGAACAIYRQEQPVWCVDWAPQGHYFVSGQGEDVLLWSVQHRKPLRILGSSTADVQAVRVLPDGRRVAVAYGNSLVLWDLTAAAPTKKLRFAGHISSVACTEGLLAAGLEDGQLGLVDLRKEQSLSRGHEARVTAMDFGRMAKEDVLFSAAGCHLQMWRVGDQGLQGVKEIKLGMSDVLCVQARAGHTLVLGA